MESSEDTVKTEHQYKLVAKSGKTQCSVFREHCRMSQSAGISNGLVQRQDNSQRHPQKLCVTRACPTAAPRLATRATAKKKKKKKERKEKKKDYQHLFLNPFHHGYLSWYKANGQDDRSVQELVHLFHACLVCSPWGYEEPEKSSLCAGEAPSSKLYPRALQCKVPGATEKEGTDAGGTRVGSDKGSVKQIMMGKSMGRGV